MVFQVIRPIFSLPHWHGGRWCAWFREACKSLPFKFDDLALAIYPERFGQERMLAGEKIVVRMILSPNRFHYLTEFAAALQNTCPKGEFSPASLRLTEINDFGYHTIFWQDGEETNYRPSLFSERALVEEIASLRSLSRFSLVFKGPLRLAAPRGVKDKSYEKLKYCQPNYFMEARQIIHLVEHIRFLDEEEKKISISEDLAADLTASNLHWHDMRYNPIRQMALGGICGRIVFNGNIGYDLARHLVLGQYLGAGKNGRFGFGFWQIPEISRSSAPRDA